MKILWTIALVRPYLPRPTARAFLSDLSAVGARLYTLSNQLSNFSRT